MTQSDDWGRFCEQVSMLMQTALADNGGFPSRALHQKKAFARVVDFVETTDLKIDPSLRDDIFNLLMEVGGTGPKYFEELLGLFERRAPEVDVRQYFKT